MMPPQSGSFTERVEIYLIQCDAEVQSVERLTSLDQLHELIPRLKLRGFGGTDFRPVFAYVDRLLEEKKLTNLNGLLYFTDGVGTYPEKSPAYKTAFIFNRDDHISPHVPSWAIRAVLTTDNIRLLEPQKTPNRGGHRIMDIASAKQQIKIPCRSTCRGRSGPLPTSAGAPAAPSSWLGAPGLGKTAIMQQVADEMGLGLVSYSMTHHTRQSALGLPVIVEKEYGGKHYQVSEYTMSEIIASVYDCMRTTGKTQGILFLDEINCVSETLSPAMLLFLQYKVFGGHQIPEGWVVVTAGNPPRFNKSVREFDAATRDRLKVIEVEPSYEAWKAYALEHGVSRSVISYLDIRPEDFYKVETTVDGLTVVTPRAWEDLSEILQYHEELGLAVSEELTTQYLQNKQVARDFAIYYELYQKYRQAYNIDALLQGVWDEDVLTQARSAKMDERMSLVSLLLEAVFLQMERCTLRHDALCLIVAALKAQRGTLDVPGDALTALAGLEDNWRAEADKVPSAPAEGLSRSAVADCPMARRTFRLHPFFRPQGLLSALGRRPAG